MVRSKLVDNKYEENYIFTILSYKDKLPTNNILNIYLPHRDSTWTLKSATEVKYLGITIDCNLKWSKHINNITKKLRTLLYLFYQIKNILDLKTLISVYYSLVQSHILYGIIAWGGAFDNSLRPLEIINKTFLKTIFNLNPRHPTEQLYKDTQTLNIRELYAKTALLKLIKDEQISKKIVSHTYPTRLRQGDNIDIPRAETARMQRTYVHTGHILFNKLPFDLKNKILYKNFKKLITSWLLQSQIDNIFV